MFRYSHFDIHSWLSRLTAAYIKECRRLKTLDPRIRISITHKVSMMIILTGKDMVLSPWDPPVWRTGPIQRYAENEWT